MGALLVLRWVIGLPVALALVASVAGVWAVRRPFPETDGTATLAGLEAPVTVHRDEWGVPHLYGDSDIDLVMAQGYVHAQDRFWEMDVRRHVTAGRLAEMFGEDQVETDAFIRTLGWRRVAEMELELLEDRTLRLLEAYAAGVNAYLADRSPGEVSLEYAILGLTNSTYEIEPWTPADTVAWAKALAWDLRSNAGQEIERSKLSSVLPLDRLEDLYPAYPAEFDPIVTGEAAAVAGLGSLDASGGGIGSNSWAVSGDLTESGGALLADDPHLAPSLPGIWHQVGLHCRTRTSNCELDVSGFGFSGVPLVVVGRNDRIAWGVTNLASDVYDHYVERVDGDRYEVDGEWRDMEVRTETIRVAGGDDVEVTIRETHRGPVLSDADATLRELLDTADIPGIGTVGADGHAISVRWTGLDPGTTVDAIFDFPRVGSFAEFRDAARKYVVPAQNLLYADADGHIGYQAPGLHPLRAEGHDGRWPVPGWTSEYDWQGFIPFDDLPVLYDPPEGYIATANEPVVGPEYEYEFPGSWAPGFRGERIDQLLRQAVGDGVVDVEELVAIQADDRILLADILLEPVLAVETEGRVADAQALLDGWDGQMARDSAAAAYFAGVMRHVLLGTFDDDLPESVPVSDRGGMWILLDELLDEPDDPWWDDTTTPEVEDRDTILRAALVEAEAELTELLGDDLEAWAWGELHQLDLTHGTLGESGIGVVEALFNRGPVNAGGAGSVVDATGWAPEDGYGVDWVPSMRMVADTGAPDDSRWINLTGNSGHAFHANYTDMAPLWAANETVPWLGSPEAIEDAADATLELVP